MSATLETGADTLRVGGELDFASVGRLLVEGERWLRGPAPPRSRLDFSAVNRANSAGVALLLGWLRVAGAAGKSVTVEQLPESLLSLLHLAGLEPVISPFLSPAGSPVAR
ncbi:MAG: lipid asymmetry maintenance protein MlaB [Anaerolineae bacterium]